MTLVISNWTFDKDLYTTGETVTLTVNYTSTDTTTTNALHNITVTVADTAATTTQASNATTSFPPFSIAGTTAPDATTVSVADDRTPPGVWSLMSNTFTGTAAPYSGVAVLTTVA